MSARSVEVAGLVQGTQRQPHLLELPFLSVTVATTGVFGKLVAAHAVAV
jgi:hypothetical protein